MMSYGLIDSNIAALDSYLSALAELSGGARQFRASCCLCTPYRVSLEKCLIELYLPQKKLLIESKEDINFDTKQLELEIEKNLFLFNAGMINDRKNILVLRIMDLLVVDICY